MNANTLVNLETTSHDNLYKKLSEERKQMQMDGSMPEFYTTAAWQFFKSKYLFEADTVKEQFTRIAKTAASHLPKKYQEEGFDKFFNMLWRGWLSPSTPVLANMGTNRGLSVSCSGGLVEDSIHGFYSHSLESAMLTKNGFGTSGYLGNIRPRGSKISVGGTASGVVSVFGMLVQMTRDVAQGTARRGAYAGYLPIDHGDFFELADWVQANPDDANVGWVIFDEFKARLKSGDKDALARFQRALKLKMVTGKGYFQFHGNVNRQSPQMYKDLGLEVKASNLCAEVALMSDKDHTFTCVLSSLNLARYDEWKDTDTIHWATIFLDCVAEDFIVKARKIKGLEAAVRFTEKSRALGLGVCGFHTYLQSHMMAFEGLAAQFFNKNVFKEINQKSLAASQWMAKEFGEPEWCKGYGVRNTHRMAVAPTKSSAILIGNVSEGINPDPAMTFTQLTAGGEIERINSELVKLMKSKEVYSKKHIQEVIDADGSVQGVEWLNEEEKLVFKTAFEINQEVVLRLASQRQPDIDQAQSINLFLDANEDERWISHLHKLAFEDPNLKSLYYIHSKSGVKASKDCVACS
jgi:ribonucleoside-diphosphate reductase alpha chain